MFVIRCLPILVLLLFTEVSIAEANRQTFDGVMCLYINRDGSLDNAKVMPARFSEAKMEASEKPAKIHLETQTGLGGDICGGLSTRTSIKIMRETKEDAKTVELFSLDRVFCKDKEKEETFSEIEISSSARFFCIEATSLTHSDCLKSLDSYHPRRKNRLIQKEIDSTGIAFSLVVVDGEKDKTTGEEIITGLNRVVRCGNETKNFYDFYDENGEVVFSGNKPIIKE